jgi:tetratricopeptide (TPR) repeat protein
MSWWKKLFSDRTDVEDVDYYQEGLELLRSGKYHEALTSFRLAQRQAPDDTAVMQQIAIAYTRIGMTDEAARTYRGVLAREPDEAGAHYGLAFLLLREGRSEEAVPHLQAFLQRPPVGPEAQRHLDHARRTLAQLTGEAAAEGVGPGGDGGTSAPAAGDGAGAWQPTDGG